MIKSRKVLRLLFLSLILKICIPSDLNAQTFDQKDKLLSTQRLQWVNQLIDNNQNDSVLIHLEHLWDDLVAGGLSDSVFGLQLQLARARALEQNHKQADAILLFNEIKSKSKAIEQWNVYAEVSLSLAQLYEILYRKQLSKENLDHAGATITQNQLDNLNPSFYIRRAMWNITFRQHPDTTMYYSQKALSAIKDTDIISPGLRFSVYLIQGTTTWRRDYLEAVEWYKKAVVIAKNIQDPVRMSIAWNKIAKSYKDYQKNYDDVLSYNDSTIQACYRAIAEGHERIYTLHDAYKVRSRLFNANGQIDSAFHYLNKGLSQENTYIRQQQFDRVAEVDARYQDEQKTKRLEEQAKIILYEQRNRNLLLAIFAATLLLAIALTLGLISHRRSMRKLAEQNRLIQQQSEQLKSLDVAKSKFFANVSHELRTPLTLVLGPIKTALKSETLNNRNFTLLTMARQNAQNLLQLVGSILDLSKIEHGKLILEEKPENLFHLLRRIVSTFESHAQREGIELTFHYQAEIDLRLQVDGLKLKDILNNLLSNAIKFTQHGGKIQVVTKDKGNAILISVLDTGRGITPDDLPHVFDRFYQSKEENAPTEGGTGIGLAFCYELATLMEGKIWVESQPGEGSTFYVELPRKEVLGVPEDIEDESLDEQMTITTGMPVNEKADDKNALTKAGSNHPTILVVEDNYSLRDYLTTILDPYYKVVTASNGKEAFDLLNQNSNVESQTVFDPSLIISDVMMPVMDGFQLMEKLKADDRYNHLPLIMLTARADIRDKLKALRIGVDDYILKPFDEEEVLARISNLLESYAIRKEVVGENAAQNKETSAISEQDRQWLETFETYIQQKLADELINIPDLARQFTMSESTLLRQLKYLTGLTPAKYVQEMRLDKLERHVYNSVNQVAREVGYKDSRSFSRSFKKRYGKLPSEYFREGVV